MRTRICLFSGVIGLILAACAASAPSEKGPLVVAPTTPEVTPAAPTVATVDPPAASSPDSGSTVISASGASNDAGPKACGCSLCEPVVSDDACGSDADCAPSVPCHAPKCVAVANARLRKPGDMCSMIMMCLTKDANRCECLKGKCALSPRR